MENKKNSYNKKKLKAIFLACIFIILFIVIAFTFWYMYNSKNITYQKKIECLGFNEMYNNKKATFYESVTKLEALKIVFMANYNRSDIDNLGLNLSDCNSDEEKWLKYCRVLGIYNNDSVNLSNYNDKVTLIEFLTFLNNSRRNILNDRNAIDAEISYSDLSNYSENDKSVVAELVQIGVLEDTNNKLNGYKSAHKKDINRIIINYILKYNTVSLNGYTITLNDENMPSNAEKYPYIVNEVEKEIYEQEPIIQDKSMYYAPVDFYKYEKTYYKDIVKTAEDYYNVILNVNYDNISLDEFIEKIGPNVHGLLKRDEIEEYIDYVKKNKIVINGKVSAQIPVIYNDGVSCRIRLKLEFEVVQSDTDENLLCFDSIYGAKVNYKDKRYTLYIDQEMGYVINSYKVFTVQNPVYSMLLDVSKDKLEYKYSY